MQVGEERRLSRRKVMAVASGALVLAVGVTATLAAWTDTEWVFGGNGAGGPGIGTSAFEVEQSTVAPFTTFDDDEENPGGEIVFAPDADALSPGEEIFAAVALRTAADSIGGTLTLQPAVPAAGIAANDPAGLLFGALDVTVATDDAPFACDATAFAAVAGGPAVIADGDLAAAGGTASQVLAGGSGTVQHYCFLVTLPDGFTPAAGTTEVDYMGLSVAPAWLFAAESE